MNIYLKPCPFCGREAVLSSIHIGGGDYRALVTCTRIGLSDGCASVMVERSSKKTAELDAVKKWNTRAERTCSARPHYSTRFDTFGTVIGFDCSECAYALTQDPDRPILWRYCPNCGAKVVEEWISI